MIGEKSEIGVLKMDRLNKNLIGSRIGLIKVTKTFLIPLGIGNQEEIRYINKIISITLKNT